VATVAPGGDGQTLTLKYKDGTQTIKGIPPAWAACTLMI